MKKEREKRTNKRKNFQRPITFELNAIEEGRTESIHMCGEALDISSGGIGLSTTYTLKRGEILKVFLPAIAKSASLPIFSEVVWVRQSGGQVEAGLRFLG
jgi:hypothetical protein